MKVREFIEKLKTFDQELPICWGDWNEGYMRPRESILDFSVR